MFTQNILHCRTLHAVHHTIHLQTYVTHAKWMPSVDSLSMKETTQGIHFVLSYILLLHIHE